MNFADLYRFSNGLATPVVPVEKLRERIVAEHPTVGAVDFWACNLDPDVSLGHMVLSLDRSSPYDDNYIVASIRYDKDLDQPWRRFVCCKELMHVFDSSLERVSSREQYLKLMEELENNPIAVNRSPMFESERNAEWMALLVLCPQRLRDFYLQSYKRGEMNDDEVASKLVIPPVLVRALMGEQYERTHEKFTGEPLNPILPGAPIPFAPKKRPPSRA